MRRVVTSRIMARTTLDIDQAVLREARRIAGAEGKSLGQVVSELAARALAERTTDRPGPAFRWISRPMRARVNLDDKDAVYALLDRA
jgi:hypothetical protein